jgi:hypothetical protein
MPIADAGGINVWTEFDGSTRNNYIEGLTTSLLLAGWSLSEKVFSSITGTFGSNPSPGQTITAGYQTYTFVAALGSPANEVLIGGSLGASLANLAAAVNLAAGSGLAYSSATPINPIIQASTTGSDVTFSFRYAGPMGNSTPTTFGLTVGGGFKLTGQSPQAQAGSLAQMSSKLHIYDRGAAAFGNLYANAQFLSTDETLSSGEQYIKVARALTYRCVANQAQFFCYIPGTAADKAGSVLCGGVPWIAPASACAGDVPQIPATLSFWTSGDYGGFGGGGVEQTTPRTVTVGISAAHFSDVDQLAQVMTNKGDANGWGSSDAAYNGDVTSGDFHLTTMSPAYNYGVDLAGNLVDSLRWHGGNGVIGRRMLLEPLVAWSPSSGGAPLVRGQLWNAWIGTDQVPMDTVQQFGDGNFYVAFTNACKFGTLWLQVPGPNPFVLESVSYAH